MRLEELNWFDVENYLQNDDRLILVIGACEQHGYLSLLTNVNIPLALADAASQQSNVLIAPPLNYGCSSYFMEYPGTFSLRVSTLLDAVEDLVRSAHHHGFRRLLILNGHQGNDPVKGRLFELASELTGLQLSWYSWWLAHGLEHIAAKYELKPAHGNWVEAFPFNIVAELPQHGKVPPRFSGLSGAKQTRQVLGDGSFGGPYQVSAEILSEIFRSALEDVLELLKFQ